MLNLTKRLLTLEEMDNPNTSQEQIEKVLENLNTLNYLSCTSYFITKALIKILPKDRKSLTLLDIGCGRGDILIRVTRNLIKHGINIHSIGIDNNQNSVNNAKQHAARFNLPIEFYCYDATKALDELKYDLVCSSLFLHHLPTKSIVEIFKIIKLKASIGFVMSDLKRSKWAFILTLLATRLVSRSKIIHSDGLKSVQSSFTLKELQRIMLTADLTGFTINSCPPCNLMLSWKRKCNAINN